MTLSLSDPRVQEAIHALEIEKEIKPIQKALILMVADGKKPATWQVITSKKWSEGDSETRISAARWSELNYIFDALGLVSVVQTRLDDTTFVQPKNGRHQWIELADVFLSRDNSHAHKLASAVASGDHRRIGIHLGFPQSAIDAFMSKNTIPISEWPKSTDTIDEESMKFLNHMISRDNWKEEISYLPLFSQRVKELSSIIYYDCITKT